MRGEKNHNSSIFFKKFSATPLSLTVNSSLISNIQILKRPNVYSKKPDTITNPLK
jgi:hypothetical protein